MLESPQVPLEERDGLIFQQLFRLLALLPLRGIHCNRVATPLLNIGEHKEHPEALYPAILDAIDNGFRHVTDSQRFIIFDLEEESLQSLCTQINETLRGSPLQQEALTIKDKDSETLSDLSKKLGRFQRKDANSIKSKEIGNGLAVLSGEI